MHLSTLVWATPSVQIDSEEAKTQARGQFFWSVKYPLGTHGFCFYYIQHIFSRDNKICDRGTKNWGRTVPKCSSWLQVCRHLVCIFKCQKLDQSNILLLCKKSRKFLWNFKSNFRVFPANICRNPDWNLQSHACEAGVDSVWCSAGRARNTKFVVRVTESWPYGCECDTRKKVNATESLWYNV